MTRIAGQLDAKGLKVKKGVIQEATFITSDPGHAKADKPRGDEAETRRSKDGTRTGDIAYLMNHANYRKNGGGMGMYIILCSNTRENYKLFEILYGVTKPVWRRLDILLTLCKNFVY
jgi:hypothetical protein